MNAGKIIKAPDATDLEKKRQLLQKEQVALVAILDQLQPFDEGSRYKLVKTACDFFNLRLME